MAATVTAARWSDDLDIEVTQKTPSAPGRGQVQLAVGSAGICGSDLHFYRGQFPARPGITPGHEFAGTVTAVGAGVKHVREGDLVGIEPLLRCGICPFCISGDYHVCGDRGLVGENADGGMSERATVPAETAFKAPSGLDAEAAALAEPLACSVHAFNKVQATWARDGVHRRRRHHRADRRVGSTSVRCEGHRPSAPPASTGSGPSPWRRGGRW